MAETGTVRELKAVVKIESQGEEKLAKLEEHFGKLAGFFHGLNESVGKLKEIGGIVAEVFAVDQIKEFVQSQYEAAAQLKKTSTQLGMSVENLQRYQYAADATSVGAQMLTTGLARLQMQLGGATSKGTMGGKAAQRLAQLGIKTRDASGHMRDATAIFGDLADKIKGTQSSYQRAAIAQEVFGRGGRQMLPLLVKGKDGIHELTKEADDLGIVMNEKTIATFEKAEDAQKKLDASTKALKATIAVELIPVFLKFTELMRAKTAWFIDLAKHTTAVKSAMAALATVLSFKLYGALSKLLGLAGTEGVVGKLFKIGKMGLFIAAITAAYLIFDDLFALFSGNKSLIGETMDTMFGVGYSSAIMHDLKKTWDNIVMSITGADSSTMSWGETFHAIAVTMKGTLTWLVAVIGSVTAILLGGLNGMWLRAKIIKRDLAGESHDDLDAQLAVNDKTVRGAMADYGNAKLGEGLDKLFQAENQEKFKRQQASRGFVFDDKLGGWVMAQGKDRNELNRAFADKGMIRTLDPRAKTEYVKATTDLEKKQLRALRHEHEGKKLSKQEAQFVAAYEGRGKNKATSFGKHQLQGGVVHIHQTIHAHGDKETTKKAVEQGTGQALSRAQLTATHRAVTRRAPPQEDEVFNP